jgi:hypothetical protein
LLRRKCEGSESQIESVSSKKVFNFLTSDLLALGFIMKKPLNLLL